MGHPIRTSDVVVSDHAIRRLRQRCRHVAAWSRARCTRWIAEAVAAAEFSICRSNGEVLIRADLAGRILYVAVLPSAVAGPCLVRTVLTHAFAANNLSHHRR